MPRVKIKNPEIAAVVTRQVPDFPKYTTQILNLANSNAQGTRPSVVGQMTELFPAFGGRNYEEWEAWYKKSRPTALDDATARVDAMMEKLKQAMELINKEMVRRWVEDLVLVKTFAGLCFQEAIIAKIAQAKGLNYRVSTAEEESRGIDGHIGDTAISVKPSTYSSKGMLSEELQGKLVLYEKKKDGITFSYDF